LQYPGFLFPGTSQYSSSPAPKGLSIKVVINTVNPFNWIKIGRELNKLKPDLIVVRYWLPFMGPCLGTILRKVKKNKFTRITCIADNIIPHEKRFGDKAFTKYFIKPVDGFIAMSFSVMNNINSIAPQKPAFYVPHPLYDHFGDKVDRKPAREHLQLPADAKIVLFFGFIRHYKGLDILLDAIALLQKDPETADQYKFLIAGEFYEDRKPYDEQIQRLGIASELIMHTHFIADEEVKYYLSASDLVVQPYRSATQSGVTQVGYFYNKPMIVTNVGGLPELVPNEKAGFVVEKDPNAIAAAIERFYNENHAKDMIAFVKEEKLKYSWEKMIDSLWKAAQV
jgi:glycosyltransferase involved in cell wall biosynthesis